jgi:hypothetical protein
VGFSIINLPRSLYFLLYAILVFLTFIGRLHDENMRKEEREKRRKENRRE